MGAGAPLPPNKVLFRALIYNDFTKKGNNKSLIYISVLASSCWSASTTRRVFVCIPLGQVKSPCIMDQDLLDRDT